MSKEKKIPVRIEINEDVNDAVKAYQYNHKLVHPTFLKPNKASVIETILSSEDVLDIILQESNKYYNRFKEIQQSKTEIIDSDIPNLRE